jgi:hypothetical protein
MSDMAALERRYRRLLAWYPPAHRGTYGEEMIGVLLASTPTDKDRPSKADALDLIGGGLRTRLRQLRTGEGNPAWRDALAVFSVVAPIVLLGWLTAGYAASLAEQIGLPRQSFRFQIVSRVDGTLLTALIATAVAVAALAICPALVRRRRAAAATVVGALATTAAVIGLVQVYRVFGSSDSEPTLYLSLIAAMEVLALVASPGPARGWQLLSRRGVIVLTVISVGIVAASAANGTSYQYWNYVNTISDLSGIVTMLGVALTLRWPVGSRLMALWAIPGYQFLGFAAAQHLFPRLQFTSWRAFEIEFRFLPTAVVAVLVGLAAWRSGRHDAARRNSI